ncbi:MAG: T9SS type A sorting domain-containing protein, partial [Candidatus Cloacimonetes bacterium]|nr:T9SS type A sorting domain-containing protein [Candidatus Cloacimonadota bacterium]
FYFTEGSFYIGVLEAVGSSAIGLDNSTNGNSYNDIGGWHVLTDGTLMIRAIVDRFTSENGQEIEPVTQLSVNNYPNPFNPTTNIVLNIPKEGKVNVTVYNLKGQTVNTLLNEVLPIGQRTLVWNGTDHKGNQVSSGVYFYRVETNEKTINKKMILLK